MRAPYEIMIGTRYLRSTQRRGLLSFISIVSILGLALGVAVLIVVLSVMNGFERELRSRILSVTSHATLMGLGGTLPDWRAVQVRAQERRAVSLTERIRGGTIDALAPGSYRIVLGDALAEALDVRAGDDVVLIAPRGGVTPAGLTPTMRRFQVSG